MSRHHTVRTSISAQVSRITTRTTYGLLRPIHTVTARTAGRLTGLTIWMVPPGRSIGSALPRKLMAGHTLVQFVVVLALNKNKFLFMLYFYSIFCFFKSAFKRVFALTSTDRFKALF